MRTIQPYDFSQVKLQDLIDQKKILYAKNNKTWSASIFPKSKELNQLAISDKDHIITQLDDTLFKDFIVLDKLNQIVMVNHGTGKRFIKCVEIGDFNDSVKRYTQLDKPVDYSLDAKVFLNLPKFDMELTAELNVNLDIPIRGQQPIPILYHRDGSAPTLFHVPDIELPVLTRKAKPDMFDTPINHPHINIPKPSLLPFKNNNKGIIEQIFKWAKTKGIKYIYCINEYRPNVISSDYVTPYVYYTIKGSY